MAYDEQTSQFGVYKIYSQLCEVLTDLGSWGAYVSEKVSFDQPNFEVWLASTLDESQISNHRCGGSFDSPKPRLPVTEHVTSVVRLHR